MRIVVGSVLSRYPLVAGSVVNRLNFVVGLQRLGHEVFLVEEIEGRSCVDADGAPSDHERSANRALFLELADVFGLGGRACQIVDGGRACAGVALGEFLAATKGALLINMSGHVTSDAVLGNAGRRVYVDQDPVYTQLWHAEYGVDLNFDAHDAFFSVGLNIGTPHSPIPNAGRTWHPLLPVIVPELWTATRPSTNAPARFTTVASWSGYGDLEYRGKWFGNKHEMFTAYADLPTLTGQSFEVALKSHRDDDPGIERLRRGGWTISSGRELSTIERYREFIRGSTAEIGVAKGAYVGGQSGWFSDRAAHYLASGRPVLAQATGFERVLPTGEGVVTFETPDDAVAGVERIRGDLAAHSDAALAFVREHLDYRRVLPEALERCLDGTSGPTVDHIVEHTPEQQRGTRMTRVIVGSQKSSGVPEFAGSSWVRLQYVLGLRALGIESYWVDRLPRVKPDAPHGLSYLTARFAELMARFGLERHYCIVYDGGAEHFGLTESELVDVVEDTDLVINISGHLPEDSPLMRVPHRAYVDVDPGFTQIWAEQVDMNFDRHTHFFTIGQTLGTSAFEIPLNGVDWRVILPPVFLDEWPARIDESATRFSTVADWRGSQEAIRDGVYHGGKRNEFVRFLRLPQDTGERFELALCIGQHDHEDMGLLDGHLWKVRNFAQYAGDVDSYREFIQTSRAEFSVAKSGYVRSNSGWVSDRTACYLASGKPALVQSTGFEGVLPTGEGLITFETLDEAHQGVEEIDANYIAHAEAARRIAEEHFDSKRVLSAMLDHVGLA